MESCLRDLGGDRRVVVERSNSLLQLFPMKTCTLPFRWIPCVNLAAALVCLPCLPTRADPLAPPAATSDIKATKYDLEIEEGQLIRPGGRVEATLPNVVNALRDEYTDANIVLAPGLAKLKVSDLKLRAGSPAEELEAVRVACDDKFQIQTPGGPDIILVDPTSGLPLDRTTGFPLSGGKRQNPGLFVLRAPKPTPETQRVVEAFNIGPYVEWVRRQSTGSGKTNVDLTDQGLQEIAQIIHDTVSDVKGGSPENQPTWQYHKGATLLVVIGTRDSVEIAGKIVNVLPGMSSVGEQSRAQYGLQSGRAAMSPDRAAAEEAFRKRYGLSRPLTPNQQNGPANPETSPPN
jgi:hypothetical protein